jgi:hypothetical protein
LLTKRRQKKGRAWIYLFRPCKRFCLDPMATKGGSLTWARDIFGTEVQIAKGSSANW